MGSHHEAQAEAHAEAHFQPIADAHVARALLGCPVLWALPRVAFGAPFGDSDWAHVGSLASVASVGIAPS